MKTEIEPKDRLLSRISVFFFDKPLLTAVLWLALTIFGAVSYTTLLGREGFPSVNFPLAIVGGAYVVDDPARVDSQVAGPITELAMQQEGVSSVQTSSGANFFSIQIMYEETVDAKDAAAKLEQTVKDSGRLPKEAIVQYQVPYFGATGGDTDQLDMAISFYNTRNDVTTEQLVERATAFSDALKNKQLTDVQDVFVKQPFEDTINPATGSKVSVQRNFDRFGLREDGETRYYSSVIIGVAAREGFDVIKLDEAVREAVEELTAESSEFANFDAKVSASNAPLIEENISELQRSLLEGLIAILVVGSIVIAIRASFITVISMITVVAVTLGFLYVIGYTLNVITLFSLILALALIVDDTIIMVEAIDAARHRHTDRRRVVKEAVRKISRAMVAATLTASLSFAPLLFVGGILGGFIRAIPITVIAALLISLLVALFFIPFFARYILLGKKHLGKRASGDEIAAGFEAKVAEIITRPMAWARHSKRKLFAVGSGAVLIGLSFIVAGLLIASNVAFNIFPPTKDTNGLIVNLTFPAGTSIEQANEIAADADKLMSETLGENFVQGAYFSTANEQQASQQIQLISYSKRDVTSRQLVDQLQQRFDSEFKEARAAVGQLDVGPPASSFIVQIAADNRENAFRAANDLKAFMDSTELERPNGSKARFVNVNVSSINQYIRDGGKPVVTVSAGFDGDDTSTLVTLGEQKIDEEFTTDKLAGYGLPEDAIQLNLGFESENQESFATLALAFPVLLVVMYVLLAVQFRSLLQPLLIFMAIPFSLFGIALGLDITENSFSFFAMLGFFALLGLSIKNTILLTDYANQARKAGMGVVDSAVEALRERFRPLFATSVTAVVSLIPLAITSPFWEGLMVVLIFGLVSSTFLVITVFPYYYLGAEYLRQTISRRDFLIWLIVTLLVAGLVGWLAGLTWGLLVIPFSIATAALQGFYARRMR